MNHWYAADSISAQHRQDLDREAAADALARAARPTGTHVVNAAVVRQRQRGSRPVSNVRSASSWRRRALVALLGVARTAEGWLEARLAIAEESAS